MRQIICLLIDNGTNRHPLILLPLITAARMRNCGLTKIRSAANAPSIVRLGTNYDAAFIKTHHVRDEARKSKTGVCRERFVQEMVNHAFPTLPKCLRVGITETVRQYSVPSADHPGWSSSNDTE